MNVVILVCDLYVAALSSCTERSAVAIFEAAPSQVARVIDTYITPRDTSYRERIKVLRKFRSAGRPVDCSRRTTPINPQVNRIMKGIDSMKATNPSTGTVH